MTGNRDELAGRPRRGRHGLLTARARRAFSAPHARRALASTPSHRCPHGRPPRAPIASCRPGTCPLRVVATLPRATFSRFARAPPWSRLETYPPFGGPPFCFRGFPAEPGTPLRECRASLSRSSGGPAASETRERRSRKSGSQPKGQES
jgi:hypothetical protein